MLGAVVLGNAWGALRHCAVFGKRRLATPCRRSGRVKLRLTAALAAVGLAVLCGSAFAQPVMAHGFGERYDLPLPLRFFVMAGAAAVALSFVIAAVFLREGAEHRQYPRYNLLRIAPVRWLASSWSLATVRTISVALTVYVIFGGFFGSERAALNPAPAAVYVAFWVALSFFTAIIGNLWALVNPWKIAWGFLARAAGSLQPGALAQPKLAYPAKWGLWPALLVFLAFAILETVIAGAAGPRALAWILVIYTVYNFLGMYLFGRDVWLRNAEGFTVVYGFMARFAITEVSIREVSVARSICVACSSAGGCADDAGDCVDCYECYALAQPSQRRFNLRPPGVGLNRIGAVTLPAVCVVVLLLSTVSFDGLSATPEWLSFSTWFVLQTPSFGGYIANLIGVFGLPALFGALFAATCALMALLSGRAQPEARQLVRVFVFSLLPIALAYHFAHFLGFLFINGQRFIVLVSDPFGWGWDLFGTAGAVINIGILSPSFIWYFSIAAIVIGHIAGVYLAHVQAVRLYGERRPALLSQLPMLGLMVCYTCASLWIISRPIAA